MEAALHHGDFRPRPAFPAAVSDAAVAAAKAEFDRYVQLAADADAARKAHLAWCKERAYDYIAHGQLALAWASFVSDIGKEPSTAGHPGLLVGSQLLVGGLLDSPKRMRDFIDGFN